MDITPFNPQEHFDIIINDDLGIQFAYMRHGWMHAGFIHANKEIPEDRRLTYMCHEIMDYIRRSDHTECYKKMASPDKNRIFLTRDHSGVTIEAHGELAEIAKEEYETRCRNESMREHDIRETLKKKLESLPLQDAWQKSSIEKNIQDLSYARAMKLQRIKIDDILREHRFIKASQNNYGYGNWLRGYIGSVEIWERN